MVLRKGSSSTDDEAPAEGEGDGEAQADDALLSEAEAYRKAALDAPPVCVSACVCVCVCVSFAPKLPPTPIKYTSASECKAVAATGTLFPGTLVPWLRARVGTFNAGCVESGN